MRIVATLLLTAGLLSPAVLTPALAQLPAPPARQEVLLDGILLSPFQPYEAWFPNVFDPLHPKLLTLDVFAGSVSPFPGTPGQPTEVTFKFDWRNLSGGTEYSPEWKWNVDGTSLTHLQATYLIPYCPQEVSIHFETSDSHVGLLDGTFVHECMVPEASESAMLMGMGALGFGLIRWYRKPSAT